MEAPMPSTKNSLDQNSIANSLQIFHHRKSFRRRAVATEKQEKPEKLKNGGF
jgi:hypothetical protein